MLQWGIGYRQKKILKAPSTTDWHISVQNVLSHGGRIERDLAGPTQNRT